MNPSAFGITTLGRVSAFMTSSLPMMLASARMYADTAYRSSSDSDPGV